MRASPVVAHGSSGERTEYRNRVFPLDERSDQPLHSSRSAGAGLHLRGGTPPVSPLGYNFRTGMGVPQTENAGQTPECWSHSRGFFLPLEKSPNWPLFWVASRYVTTNQDGTPSRNAVDGLSKRGRINRNSSRWTTLRKAKEVTRYRQEGQRPEPIQSPPSTGAQERTVEAPQCPQESRAGLSSSSFTASPQRLPETAYSLAG